jgi:hypothetical protein
LAEPILCIADCFRRKKDGLDNGSDKENFIFDAENTEYHASAHLHTNHHRQNPAWFESSSLTQFLLRRQWCGFNGGNLVFIMVL